MEDGIGRAAAWLCGWRLRRRVFSLRCLLKFGVPCFSTANWAWRCLPLPAAGTLPAWNTVCAEQAAPRRTFFCFIIYLFSGFFTSWDVFFAAFLAARISRYSGFRRLDG